MRGWFPFSADVDFGEAQVARHKHIDFATSRSDSLGIEVAVVQAQTLGIRRRGF